MTQIAKDRRFPLPRADREEVGTRLARSTEPAAAGRRPNEGFDEVFYLKAEAIEAIGWGVIITDRNGSILWASGAMRDLTGYSPEEIIGQNPRLFRSGRQSPEFYKQLWETILSGEQWHGEMINRRKDGGEYIEQLAITPVRNARGEVAHFIAVKKDVTSERRALEQNRKLSLAVENSTDLIAITNPDARVIYVNPAWLRVLGKREEEVLGRPFNIVLSRNNPAALAEEMAVKSYEPSGWSGECLIAGAGGKDILVSGRTTVIKDDEGRIIGSLGIARDISEKKAAEEKLRESEELFRQLAENIREVFFVNTPDMKQLIYVSPAYEELSGRTREEAYRNPNAWVDTIPAEDRERALRAFERAQKGEKTDMEYRFQRPDGSRRWHRSRTYPVRDDQGRLTRVVGLSEDVTEQKNAEEELREAQEKLKLALEGVRESEELFRQLAENIREVFLAITPDPLRVIYVSPAYEEIWGRPVAELYERPTAWVEAIHPDDHEWASDLVRRSQQREKTDMEYRIVRPDGSIRWIRHRTYPLHDTQGHFMRKVGFAEDITERKEAEAELREAQEKLNLALEEARQRAVLSEKLTERPSRLGATTWRPSKPSALAIAGGCGGARRTPSRTHPLRCVARTCTPGVTGGQVCVPLAAQGETLGLLYLQCGETSDAAEGKPAEATMAKLAQRAELVGERLSLALANLKLREVLRHQSVRDPLTGLFNRRYMEETLDRELSRAARRNESVAVAMCDLDHFKQFNDSFGHEAGDLVLREMAAALQQNVRKGDIVCRFGGEEFALILPEATVEAAAERTETIRKEVEALALTYRGHTLGKITISIGIAMYPDDGSRAEDLVRASGQALYRAKAAGRDRVIFVGCER
jgi:diguanylate cyclase (GGDEF)-like protein/PAS domain S-box-containing protein